MAGSLTATVKQLCLRQESIYLKLAKNISCYCCSYCFQPLLRDGDKTEDHAAPDAEQLPKAWTRCSGRKRRSQELKDLWGFKKALNRVAKANEVRWCGQVFKRENSDVLRRALDFEVVGRRERGQSKMTWRRQAVKQVKEIKLKVDAIN